MKNTGILILLFFSQLSFSQSIERSVIASSGQYFETSAVNMAWTIGEPFIETYVGGSSKLSQGFHQGDLFVSSISENSQTNIYVYPNPTCDLITIDFSNENQDNFISIHNMEGKLIFNTTTSVKTFSIPTSDWVRGTYLLRINDEQVFKIVKIN